MLFAALQEFPPTCIHNRPARGLDSWSICGRMRASQRGTFIVVEQAKPAPPSRVRKLIHLSLALVPALGWWVSYPLALGLAGAAMIASLVVELARRNGDWVNRLLWRLLPTTFRAWEHRRTLGSTWFSVGMLGALLLYGRDVGGTAVLFLAWGDAAAEIVGRRWGRATEGKTLAGSLGCLAACLLAGVAGVSLGGLAPISVLIGALVATLLERWSPPPNDNLWIPLLSGLVMEAIQRLL